MAKYRNRLPQHGNTPFITDGGLETTLIFKEGRELPEFAAFDLLKTAEGTAALRKYFLTYADLALESGLGFILESPTWRANLDWGRKLGYDETGLAEANRKAIALLSALREEKETPESPFVISGNLGPRGDGYVPAALMSAGEAEDYHAAQIGVFAASDADLVTAMTLNYVEEAIGIARAAGRHGMPAVLSFTVETDGRLPTGQSLQEAIEQTDAATGGYPAYYMINCAHPDHFLGALPPAGGWRSRVRGLRANASRKSHAELNESTVLDDGNPAEQAAQYGEVRKALPALNVYGGCCGTDHRHVRAMCDHLAVAARP